MRPRKLDPYYEELLVKFFYTVKSDMAGRSNQFQVASRLKSYFPSQNNTSIGEANRRHAILESTAKYFGTQANIAHNLANYVGEATPAAIVQMVKRIKIQVQNY